MASLLGAMASWLEAVADYKSFVTSSKVRRTTGGTMESKPQRLFQTFVISVDDSQKPHLTTSLTRITGAALV
ncbi:MAG: hypothetical protein RIG68_12420 [Imperialibacter sp.]|uniref:hypothetical protein n=1 Tax=Imperialibacter sp. TaxID=2038411 RepID=UPI0032ED5ECA